MIWTTVSLNVYAPDDHWGIVGTMSTTHSQNTKVLRRTYVVSPFAQRSTS